MKRMLMVLGLVASSLAPAQQVVWLDLFPLFKYTDLTVSCQMPIPAPFQLALETTDELAVVRANFRPRLVMFATDVLGWTQEEMKGLKLERDEKGRLWIADLKLNSRLVDWVMRNLGSGMGQHCPPQESVATLGPTSYTYAFDKESIEGGGRFAGQAKYYGRRKNGYAYELWLGWEQRQHRSSPFDTFSAPACPSYKRTCLGR